MAIAVTGTFLSCLRDMTDALEPLPITKEMTMLHNYRRLLHATQEKHTKAITKHRTAFNRFFDVNYDQVVKPSVEMTITGKLVYSEDTSDYGIDFATIWNHLDADFVSKGMLLQHLIVISYFSSPVRKIPDIEDLMKAVAETFKTEQLSVPSRASKSSVQAAKSGMPDFNAVFNRDDEVDGFIRDTLGKLFTKGMKASNPMQMMRNLMMNPGKLQSLMSGSGRRVSMKKVVQRLADIMPDDDVSAPPVPAEAATL